ncbi:hypothetical protein [Solitalea koreensis]|uniref:Uncharacterized protein n=1 Tax=Solitalea koreensis TaxID=543615 RepID=A0A521BZI2_9SPHI|nr:hypothetical protein [Solitalea koreensis]SMO52538.1 hypothetical protein SAMN06265350_10369 [Solitalea koreensis]
MKFLKFIPEAIAWLQIVASPLTAGLLISFIVYHYKHDTSGLIIAISIVLIALVLGIIWATKTWKKEGTVQFMSRVIATPELDKEEV